MGNPEIDPSYLVKKLCIGKNDQYFVTAGQKKYKVTIFRKEAFAQYTNMRVLKIY